MKRTEFTWKMAFGWFTGITVGLLFFIQAPVWRSKNLTDGIVDGMGLACIVGLHWRDIRQMRPSTTGAMCMPAVDVIFFVYGVLVRLEFVRLSTLKDVATVYVAASAVAIFLSNFSVRDRFFRHTVSFKSVFLVLLLTLCSPETDLKPLFFMVSGALLLINRILYLYSIADIVGIKVIAKDPVSVFAVMLMVTSNGKSLPGGHGSVSDILSVLSVAWFLLTIRIGITAEQDNLESS